MVGHRLRIREVGINRGDDSPARLERLAGRRLTLDGVILGPRGGALRLIREPAAARRSPPGLPDAQGKVDLAALMRELGARGINELHVEAGSKLNGSLLRDGLVDELLVYLAPKLIGEGLGLAHMAPLADLSQAYALEFNSVERVGKDLRILARLRGRDCF